MLNECIRSDVCEKIASVDVIILLVCNLAMGKDPLYELAQWTRSINLGAIGLQRYKHLQFTDDRYARALDKLYDIDRATLMTKLVIHIVHTFGINMDRIHNDSTTVKACGQYDRATKRGFALKHGHSKDHRPDLKQLLFTLTISADGAVPVHFKVYPGNKTDDKTHIETWEAICRISNNTSFLYVADCKVCTDTQLVHITENKGRVVTIIPRTWKEVGDFEEKLRSSPVNIPRKEIWRKKKQGMRTDYFFAYEGEYFTYKRGYRIYWIHSTDKQARDRTSREQFLKAAEEELAYLLPRINKRKLKTKAQIEQACQTILKKKRVERFLIFTVNETTEQYKKRKKGRPRKNAENEECILVTKIIYALSWSRNKQELDKEKKVDGLFPLLTTDNQLTASEVLQAYKYQPRLEKRFMQFKSIHNAAPLLFKRLERIEANMFAFFLALLVQALIEREIRHEMKKNDVKAIPIYPEARAAAHPTTSKVFDRFGHVSTYSIMENDMPIEEYRDELDNVHELVLRLMSISQDTYWKGCSAFNMA